MTRKEIITSLTTVNAKKTVVTSRPVIGTLEAVEIDSGTWEAGSLIISTSGTTFSGRTVFTNLAASGTNSFYATVQTQATGTDGVAIGGNGSYSAFGPVIVNDHLSLAVTGAGSSTAGTTGTVKIYYNTDN